MLSLVINGFKNKIRDYLNEVSKSIYWIKWLFIIYSYKFNVNFDSTNKNSNKPNGSVNFRFSYSITTRLLSSSSQPNDIYCWTLVYYKVCYVMSSWSVCYHQPGSATFTRSSKIRLFEIEFSEIMWSFIDQQISWTLQIIAEKYLGRFSCLTNKKSMMPACGIILVLFH